MRERQLFILSLLIFITVSCKQDTKQLPLDNLLGYWDVYAAERNGNKTSLLDGAFFEIKEDNMITTNVNGDTLTTQYVLSKNSIRVEDIKMDFRIVDLSQDSMTLFSKISNYKYTFATVRSDNKK